MKLKDLIDELIAENNAEVVVRLPNGLFMPISHVSFEYNTRDERIVVLNIKDKRRR